MKRKLRLLKRRLSRLLKKKIPLLLDRISHPKSVYLVLTPEHGNLGDHAIAQSETSLLQSIGIPFIEYSGSKLAEMKYNHVLSVMNGRPILINGGGNLGTLWFDVELLMREIITENPDSPIVILPNTLFYEDSDEGRKEFENSKAIYNSHEKLTICAREKKTYDIARRAYSNVVLIPDMVFCLNESNQNITRRGCMLCLRKDCEKTISELDETVLREVIESLFHSDIRYQDMVIDRSIPFSERDVELQKQFERFQSAELVITDRLHGMIFSAITGTPCIVIDSKSPKVRGCYEWIRHLDYIQFCDDVNNIAELYRSMPKGSQKYDNSSLMPYYDELKDVIMAAVKKR